MSAVRTVRGATGRVVVVGAGLGGLACALHLAGAGREVIVVEREPVPGGRAGRLVVGGYEFDTGPVVLTMPELVEEALGAVGERMADWLDLRAVDPVYRAFFPDGSSLDVIADPARMAGEVARVCGPGEEAGYLRFVDHARYLWRLQRRDFVERNLDSPRDLLTVNLLRLVAAGGFRRLQPMVDSFLRDPRTRRVFAFQAMYAGLAPHDALALYVVISYLDTVAGVYFPRGGVHAVPRALAAAAQKHGVRFAYGSTVSRVEVRGGRAVGVVTAAGERIAADVVVLNPDLPVAYRDLLPDTPRRVRRLRPSPSAVVLHVGSRQRYGRIAQHNLHTLRQTGPFRPGTLHPGLSNVVFVGSGTQPGVGVPMVLISGKLAAQRITGAP